ncbi:MAG: hypothetical protein BWY59_00567 [Verrucomicrobia bacterium ADurb.Bin345]|nr:MAG: hypothetical protein BWY59_00567 [Verrucomicrobia bacterium ADurb.Bin345]
MKDKKIQHAQKRKYEKPRIRAIRLSADEVLATGCKTSPVSIGFGSNLCTSGFCSSNVGS